MTAVRCARCARPIEPVSGRATRVYVLCDGRHYHVECVTGQPRVICAWCGEQLHPGDRRFPVSHGVCGDCMERVEAERDGDRDDGFERAADCVSGYGGN